MAVDVGERAKARDVGTPVHATIMFADLVGSTEELERLEREGWRDALDEARDAIDAVMSGVRSCVREFGGTIARVQGDGVLAIFGAPRVTENHALLACGAALRVRDMFRSLAASANPPKFSEVRIGVHSGRVLTRTQFNDMGSDFDILGHAANLAKKVEEKCPPNGALMTRTTRDLAGAAVVARTFDEELFELSGVVLHHDLSHQFAADNGVPLVGRDETLDIALTRIGAARQSKARPLAIIGEAGIGKSRLLYELARMAEVEGFHVEQLRGHAVHTLTPFAPVKQFTLSLLGLASNASAEETGATLSARGLKAVHLQGVLELIGAHPTSEDWNKLDPPSRRVAMLEALVTLVAHAAMEAPLLIIAEDIHEFDAETNDLLAALRSLCAKAQVAVVVSARSTARDTVAPTADEIIELRPLSLEQSRRLAQALAAGAAIDGSDIEAAVANAAGNPLFLQALMRERRSGTPGMGTPASVTSLVQARMGRLGESAKRALSAACILRSGFDRQILASTARLDEAALEAALHELERQHLIDVDEVGGISFQHDLFRMAVDDLLLRDQRQDLHRNARRALEPLSRTPERLEQLGYHAEMAGEFDGALTFILELCRLAVRSSSLKTVRALYARAKGLRPRATPQSLPVFFAVTAASFDALQQSGDRAEYRAALDFVIGHAGQVGDRVSEGLAHAHLALICWMMAKHDDGYEHAETALTIARELRSLELRALAQPCLAHIEHARGNIARAIALHAEIVEALEGELERSTLGRMIIPSVRSRAFLAWLLADVGRFAEAQAQVERADAVLKQGEQPFSRILLDAASGYLAMRSRRPRDAIAPLERAREACLALQSYVMEPAASGWLASALVRAGDPLRALEIAQQSIDTKRYEKAGRYSWVYIHQALAEAQFACGAKHPAIETVGQALSIAEQSREPLQTAYARFARAQMLFALGKRDAAMEDAQQVLSLAAKHGLDPLAADCRELFSRME